MSRKMGTDRSSQYSCKAATSPRKAKRFTQGHRECFLCIAASSVPCPTGPGSSNDDFNSSNDAFLSGYVLPVAPPSYIWNIVSNCNTGGQVPGHLESTVCCSNCFGLHSYLVMGVSDGKDCWWEGESGGSLLPRCYGRS